MSSFVHVNRSLALVSVGQSDGSIAVAAGTQIDLAFEMADQVVQPATFLSTVPWFRSLVGTNSAT